MTVTVSCTLFFWFCLFTVTRSNGGGGGHFFMRVSLATQHQLSEFEVEMGKGEGFSLPELSRKCASAY